MQYILDHYPDELEKAKGGNDAFEISLMEYLELKNDSNNSQEKIDSAKSVVNAIYKAQNKTDKDLTEQDFEILEHFFKKLFHIKLGYSDENFGVKEFLKNTIYQDLLASRSSLSEPKDSNLFTEASLKTFESIDNYQSPIETSTEKLYIFPSDLQSHCSYFIFHVNSNNKLTAISYCDGNYISSDQISIFNRLNLKGGVGMFKLDQEIEFSKNLVEEFLVSNSKNKDIYEFYQQLSSKGLRVFDPEKGIDSNLKISDYELPTRIQSRGNCGLKSLKILWRYIAKLQNQNLSFSLRETGSPTSLSSTQPQPIELDGTSLFKEFKGDLTLSQVEDLLKLKKDLSQADQQKPFNQFLTQIIDKILHQVNKKAQKKMEKNQGDLESRDFLTHKKITKLIETSRTLS